MKARNKTFLNDSHEETGYISWYVSNEGDLTFGNVLDASIRIADCSKTVDLDFECWKDADLRKRLAKANILLDELKKFTNSLETAIIEKEAKKVHWSKQV